MRHLLFALTAAAMGAALVGCSAQSGNPRSGSVAATAAPTSAENPAPGAAGLVPPVGATTSATTSAIAAAAPTSQPALAIDPAGTAATTAPPAMAQAVYFQTPEAAMRYLTGAYNRDDVAALMHVTTPYARANLLSMRDEATNLQLDKCTRRPSGDYDCFFHHDYPSKLHKAGLGHSVFTAAPAKKYGWYLTVLQECG